MDGTDLEEVPAVIVTEAQIAKVPESRKSEVSDASNFRAAASKSRSAHAAEEIRPPDPDPRRGLALDSFWMNKSELDDAESQWQLFKASTSGNQSSSS